MLTLNSKLRPQLSSQNKGTQGTLSGRLCLELALTASPCQDEHVAGTWQLSDFIGKKEKYCHSTSYIVPNFLR